MNERHYYASRDGKIVATAPTYKGVVVAIANLMAGKDCFMAEAIDQWRPGYIVSGSRTWAAKDGSGTFVFTITSKVVEQ